MLMISPSGPFQNGSAHFKSGQPVLNQSKILNRAATDTTGESPDIMLKSFPEATSGVTASHLYTVMLEVEHKAAVHNVSLIGHCTDSA